MFIDSFITYLRSERNYSPHTIKAYETDIALFYGFVRGLDESLTFNTIDKDVIRCWVSQLMDDGLESTSVNRKLSSIRSYYSYLAMRGLIDDNPLKGIISPKKRKALPSFLKEDEMDRLLDGGYFTDDYLGLRDKLIISMLYQTGIRLSELVSLDLKDIEGEQLKVTGKRNRQRLIPYGRELSEMLSLYIAQRSIGVLADGDALFLTNKGERISRPQVYTLVKKYLSLVVTIKKRSPHVLRHTFATSMLNNEAELSVVKELLGHKSLATTEIYTHLTFEELKQVYKKAHPRAD